MEGLSGRALPCASLCARMARQREREMERDGERWKREEMRKLCKLGHKADNGLLKTARLMSANRSLTLTHSLTKINLLHEHMLKLSEREREREKESQRGNEAMRQRRSHNSEPTNKADQRVEARGNETDETA